MQNEKVQLIAAVSGGIDSVVMLHRLVQAGERPLVAHVDHGLRAESVDDAVFVENLAKVYGLVFACTRLSLEAGASEENARTARYEWLEHLRESRGASTVATAHHQDDVLETIMINLARGTNWRGLCSLRETSTRRRPLIHLSKAEVVAYAIENNLQWRDDKTNDDVRFLRNYFRHGLAGKLDVQSRTMLLGLYERQCVLRQQIEDKVDEIENSWTMPTGSLSRHHIIMCDDASAQEVLRRWLGVSLETALLKRLVWFAKVARSGAKFSLDGSRFVAASSRDLVVSPREDC